ncbi:hypothetical protein EVAR_79494_1 [Eumeta japonica]|uniref:Uncharacterized protein n=1 Tax=Eumeta variegata TaxID=151549 RepID=A0A4C1UDS0_EUMVA|nr:hypothetical protein EVAR_79494_1 [Eumeta japonica]
MIGQIMRYENVLGARDGHHVIILLLVKRLPAVGNYTRCTKTRDRVMAQRWVRSHALYTMKVPLVTPSMGDTRRREKGRMSYEVICEPAAERLGRRKGYAGLKSL